MPHYCVTRSCRRFCLSKRWYRDKALGGLNVPFRGKADGDGSRRVRPGRSQVEISLGVTSPDSTTVSEMSANNQKRTLSTVLADRGQGDPRLGVTSNTPYGVT